jgi:hypothetical protein
MTFPLNLAKELIMAHVRKDTLVGRIQYASWWKHLRPFAKRSAAKAERRASKDEIAGEEASGLSSGRSKGLHKDPENMRWRREHEGEKIIPAGIYCYDEKGNCPYWDVDDSEEEQCNGFCWFLMKGDWNDGIGELWDQCKNCGVRSE